MKRIKVKLSHDDLMDLWDGVYFDGNKHEVKGEIYTQIDKVNTSDYSDGPSWDYIIQRESDKKFFKFNVWESSHGYVFEDKYIEEVFPETKTVYK